MPPTRIRLLEADPDLGHFLSEEDLAVARQLTVPVVGFAREDEDAFDRHLEEHGAFAALTLEGMVFKQLRIGDQLGLRLLGPGDIVTPTTGSQSMLVESSEIRVVAGSRLALLGRELLLGSHRWPALVRGLNLRTAQQAERLTTQLVICQLPRVDQRLLALMWLLAESWGRVTPSGTTLPLRLTHDVLGALIGARRPTVTLALRDLSERGAIVRQDTGWLLLEAPAGAAEPVEQIMRSPGLIEDGQRLWSTPRSAPVRTFDPSEQVGALSERLASLRRRHIAELSSFDERLRNIAVVRQRCQESRARVARDRVTRQRARSS